jgi:transketolase
MPSRLALANAIRVLSMDAVQKANSGHPGMPMGMADIAEVLWNDFLKHNPANPDWVNRDRFILSNGHGSMLQYALLYLSGYEVSIDDLKQFRQLHSRTPGHPEHGCLPGIETTTGPLGQGLANAVGMALAEAILSATFNQKSYSIIDHHTYCFVGDGCLMEGISHEVASFAGTLGLGKLIVFWDDNGISIDGKVAPWFSEDTASRFKAYHWQVIEAVDGHSSDAIREAMLKAKAETKKPTLICCKTTIGFGAPNLAGTEKCHGSPLGATEIALARKKLNWYEEPFVIPTEIKTAWDAKQKGKSLEKAWQTQYEAYAKAYPDLAKALTSRLKSELPPEMMKMFELLIDTIETKKENISTRKASQNVLNFLCEHLSSLLGGSADLSESVATFSNHSKAITPENFQGNYIHYGVREFGMSAMMNGMALHGGFIPYGGTFLTFLDYARNAVRLAALMKQRVILVYSHDSIGLGEDGPTHQPIEHLSMLRNTPNMSVWRPMDATETAVAWKNALERKEGPTSIILTRQNIMHQAKTVEQVKAISQGAYILREPNASIEAIIIGTGSEVALAMKAAVTLAAMGHQVRVVSMPSMDMFKAQTAAYREAVLPKTIKHRVAIEAASTQDWYQWVGLEGAVIGIDRYGESAPAKAVFEALGLTVEKIVATVTALINPE